MIKTTITIAILAVTLGLATPAPPQAAAGFARFVPPGALAYAEVSDLGTLLARALESGPVKKLAETAAWEDFTVSKLYNKLSDRIAELEEATGFGLSLENLRAAAGSRSALALYDIGELRFVFISQLSMDRIAATALWNLREGFDERRTDDGRSYFVSEDEIGRVALAFAVSGDLFIVATDVPRFEQCLSLIAGGGESLIADQRFAEAFAGLHGDPDLRLYLDHEAIAATPYFRGYWFYGNAADLAGISRVGITAAFNTAGEIREQRRIVRADPRPAETGVGTDLLAALPAGFYQEFGSLAGAGGLQAVIGNLITGIDADGAAQITAVLAPAAGDRYGLSIGAADGAAPLQNTIEGTLAIHLAKPGALDRRAFETAVARVWEKRLLYPGQGSFAFVDQGGVRALNLPLLEDQAPAWKLSGDTLVFAGSARSLTGSSAATGNAVAAAANCSFAFRFSAREAFTVGVDQLRLLAGRSNWQSDDNREFWSRNIPSFFGLLDNLAEVTLVRTAETGGEREEVVYRFGTPR